MVEDPQAGWVQEPRRRAAQAVKRREMYRDIGEEVRERSESALPVQLRTDGTAETGAEEAAAQATKRREMYGRPRHGGSPHLAGARIQRTDCPPCPVSSSGLLN